jgi:hypothetical protein
MSDIPKPFDFSFVRPRILDPHTPKPSGRSKKEQEELREESLNSVYRSYRNASDKANIIMNYASKVASKYSIPVSDDSVEIQQAVRRQDEESDGKYISFELFVRMVDIIEDMASNVTFDVIDSRVKGDPAANERVIRKQLDSRFGDDSNGLYALLLVGGQILTLYLMHLINGMWRGPEKVLAAPKTAAGAGAVIIEQASPIAEAIREAAVGFAASTFILGFNQLLSQLFLEEGNKNTNSDQVIQGAISTMKQVDLPPILGRIKTILGIDDYKVIVRYVLKYINESDKQGYEFWYAYYVARRTRFMSAASLKAAPMFSKKEHYKLNYNEDPPSVSAENINNNEISYFDAASPLSFTEQIASEINSVINQSIVTPTDQYLCATEYESSEFEKGLNHLAQILDTRLAQDVICCLVRFAVNIDVDLLKKIKAILSIFVNNQVIDVSATWENLSAYLVNWVKDALDRLIFQLIQAIIDKIYSVIVELLVDLDADLDVLMECPLILHLINAIIEALDMMKRDIDQIIRNFFAKIRIDIFTLLGLDDINIDTGDRLPSAGGLIKVHKKRSIRRIIIIIEGIINLLESASIVCDSEELKTIQEENPGKTVVTYDQIIDSPLVKNAEDYLDIPDDVKRTYFADAYEFQLQDGTHIPNYMNNEISLKNAEVEDRPSCRRELPDEILRQAIQNHKDRLNNE